MGKTKCAHLMTVFVMGTGVALCPSYDESESALPILGGCQRLKVPQFWWI